MTLPKNEPIISVGLIESSDKIGFEISGEYTFDNTQLVPGRYEVRAGVKEVVLLNNHGLKVIELPKLHFVPKSLKTGFFTVPGVAIGRNFHWERFKDQKFKGEFVFQTSTSESITVINRIPLERYLESVICSEMSSASPEEFLKAHCIVSRSWLLAQIRRKKQEAAAIISAESSWTDSSLHQHYDVCADDHCQRYHGIGSINPTARKAIFDTTGEVLVSGDTVCDTRFSKCCGGITEKFSTAWEDREVPYLMPVNDSPENRQGVLQPSCSENDARRFILSSPEAYCNVRDKNILARILPDFDCETDSFFRWKFSVSQEKLQEILFRKTGIDFGEIKKIIPLSRGASGRIYKLKIAGEKVEKVFGKELEIRRILSHTHLYSSAFIVEKKGEGFKFTGAGWGHGVGLCQIGAAAMAEQGSDYKKILCHYFRRAKLKRVY